MSAVLIFKHHCNFLQQIFWIDIAFDLCSIKILNFYSTFIVSLSVLYKNSRKQIRSEGLCGDF